MRRPIPWTTWVVGWLAAIVFAGGVAQAFAEHRRPEVRTVVRDVHVLPAGQAKVTGTYTSIRGTDVSGGPLHQPIHLDQGTATIRNGGETIVWEGGRPFDLVGGGVDLGPAPVVIDAGGAHWTMKGPCTLVAGHYELRTPVAVGRGGLATPRDSYAFDAREDAVLQATVPVVLTEPVLDQRLSGPGTLVLDGSFTVRTRDGQRHASHLEFGPGAFELDLDAGTIAATLQGPLR